MIANPWEDDHNEPEDEHRFPCACGDSNCTGDNTDPDNINLFGAWYAADCVTGQALLWIAWDK